MTQIILNIPDNEIDFFLKLVKKFNYTVSNTEFELTKDQLLILDKSSESEMRDCLTIEQFKKGLNEKYAL